MKVISLPILPRSRNYAHILHDHTHAAVIDPGDALPIHNYLKQQQLKLTDILITHHHWDHTNGIDDLHSTFPESKIIRSSNSQGFAHKLIDDMQKFTLDWHPNPITGIHIPGHTLDHIAYYLEDMLFPGDTLFSAGCGRCFEGTPAMLQSSLEKLSALPDHTQIYFAHEYTEKNCEFALSIDPENTELKMQYELAKKYTTSVPSLMSKERIINPFLRCDHPHIQQNVAKILGIPINNKIDCFEQLRAMKDKF